MDNSEFNIRYFLHNFRALEKYFFVIALDKSYWHILDIVMYELIKLIPKIIK